MCGKENNAPVSCFLSSAMKTAAKPSESPTASLTG